MQEISVRPLDYGEEEMWLKLETPRSEGPDRLEEFRGEFAERRQKEPRCFLVALKGGRCVGRLAGLSLSSKLFSIREILPLEEPGRERITEAFAAFLSSSFSKDGTEILTWDKPETADTNRILEGAGFVVGREKIFVRRDLAGYSSPHEDRFVYRSLAEIGEDRFLEVMTEAAKDDPFEDVSARDPRSDFRELVTYAGDGFDPTWWTVAFLEGDPVGVVLPQVFADKEEGTLFYVGVLPKHRGRGFGRTLHAHGLAFLAGKGVTRYVGSTDARNLPMIAVFKANGCARTGTQLFHKALRGAPSAARNR